MHLLFILIHVIFLLFFILGLFVSIPTHILATFLRKNRKAIDTQTDVIRSLAKDEQRIDSELIDTSPKSKKAAISDSRTNILIGLASVGLIYFVASTNDGFNDGSSSFTCGFTQSGLLDPKAWKLDLLVNKEWSEATLSGFKTKQNETFSISDSDKDYIFSGDMLYQQEGEPDELRYEKRYIFKKMITPNRWNVYYYADYDGDPVLAYACREN